jgi:hypothetical protein
MPQRIKYKTIWQAVDMSFWPTKLSTLNLPLCILEPQRADFGTFDQQKRKCSEWNMSLSFFKAIIPESLNCPWEITVLLLLLLQGYKPINLFQLKENASSCHPTFWYPVYLYFTDIFGSLSDFILKTCSCQFSLCFPILSIKWHF